MIGVFDSGVGGLTVVKEIYNILPNYQIIYFGDTARLPYGTKGADFVKKYSLKITNWLLKKEAKIIVVACHTSSALAGDYLKKQLKNVPIFDMITPTVKEISKIKFKKIGIIGTPGTIESNSWQSHLLKIEPNLKIYSKACPLFVPLVEEGWMNKSPTKEIAKDYLKNLKQKNIEGLVLACTHYPILKKTIKEALGKKVEIIDPAKILAKELAIFLKDNKQINSSLKKGNLNQFFFSDKPYHFKKISHFCLNQKIKPVIKDPF